MDHVTSAWAREFGLPDPGAAADQVLVTQPDMVRRLAERGRSAAAALRDGSDLARRAAGVLRSGWSTPAATVAVQALARSADAAAETCLGNAAAIAEFADALVRSHDEIRRAYAAADATIAAEGIGSDWAPLLGAIHPERGRLQCQVVMSLDAAARQAATRAKDAAARLYATIGPDPRPAGALSGGAAGDVDESQRSDARNRALLAADLTSSSPARRSFAAAIQRALAHGAAVAGGSPVQLLAYDPDHPPGQGGAAIAVGDVSTADSVAVLVPGVDNSPWAMSSPLDSTAALNRAAADAAPGTSAATVLWMGYNIPLSAPHDGSQPGMGGVARKVADAFRAVDATDAAAGGAALAGFCVQLRREMGPSAGLTLVGHSYGSTVVSQAALRLRRGDGVDDIVLLASPGAGFGARSAAGYSAVPADHVYALEFPSDPVPAPITDALAGLVNPIGTSLIGIATGTGASPFGRDPASGGFGAQVIDVPSGVPVTPTTLGLALVVGGGALGQQLAAIPDTLHNLAQHAMGNYLGGAALTAVGAVVAGRYAKVPVRPHR